METTKIENSYEALESGRIVNAVKKGPLFAQSQPTLAYLGVTVFIILTIVQMAGYLTKVVVSNCSMIRNREMML